MWAKDILINTQEEVVRRKLREREDMDRKLQDKLERRRRKQEERKQKQEKEDDDGLVGCNSQRLKMLLKCWFIINS